MVVCFVIGRLFPSDSISNSKEVTIPYFPAESFQRLVESGEPLLIIDLRDEQVFQYWHIAGSLRSNNLKRFYRIIESNPQDWLSRQVVVLCYGGGRTSLMRILYDTEKKLECLKTYRDYGTPTRSCQIKILLYCISTLVINMHFQCKALAVICLKNQCIVAS